MPQVVVRTCRAREMQHRVYRIREIDPFADIGDQIREPFAVQQIPDVKLIPGQQVVHRSHGPTPSQQSATEVGAEEPKSSGNDGSRHGWCSYRSLRAPVSGTAVRLASDDAS